MPKTVPKVSKPVNTIDSVNFSIRNGTNATVIRIKKYDSWVMTTGKGSCAVLVAWTKPSMPFESCW